MLRKSLLWCLLLVALSVWAQVDPNQPGKPPAQTPSPNGILNPDNTAVEVTARGVYLIHGGVVARYPADMGQPVLRELFGALPAQPALSDKPTDAERTAMREWLAQMRLRQAPMAVVTDDKMLHIVIGSTYFRLNADTLEVVARGELAPAFNAPGKSAPSRQAPLLKLAGENLLVVTTQELLVVQTVDGKVTMRLPPPAAMFPKVDYEALRKAFAPPTAPADPRANNDAPKP